jgi:hypothetical protein
LETKVKLFFPYLEDGLIKWNHILNKDGNIFAYLFIEAILVNQVLYTLLVDVRQDLYIDNIMVRVKTHTIQMALLISLLIWLLVI